jgi:hypothetical protein
MLIRIKQVRRKLENGDAGTDIILGKKKSEQVTLPFRPRNPDFPDREHVCDVTDAAHVAQLLAIPEGFEVHPDAMKTPAGKAAAAAATKAKAKSDGDPLDVTSLSDAELEAELARRKAAVKSDDVEADDPADTTVIPPEVDKMTRPELLAAAEKKLGKKPNPATSTKKLKELLLEKQ